MKRVSIFLFLWLTVGFSTGTGTLLGPVAWIATAGRAAGWSEGVEASVVRAVIGALVLGSAAIAAALAAVVARSPLAHLRYGVPALAIVAALGALWLWMTPEMVVTDVAVVHPPGSSFTFGPLPSEERMAQLEREGYTAVVSLLHPAVVPFELKLIADGRAAAAAAGLQYIHVPMLPWVGGNSEAVARLEGLARYGKGRYYVHCYLGKDRVGLARRTVERAEPAVPTVSEEPAPRLLDGQLFERGEIVEVAPDLFLTPYPTDDEMIRFILPGPYTTVVSLLDPDDADDLPWIEKERALMTAHAIEFLVLPIPRGDEGPQGALDVARRVASLPRPLVVHAFLSPGSGRSPVAEAFLRAFALVEAEAMPVRPPGQAPAGARGEAPSIEPAAATDGTLLARSVPSARLTILAGPPLLLWTAVAAALAGWLRTARRMAAPYTRKIFHFAIFSTAGILHFAGGLPVVSLFGGIVSAAVLYAVGRGDGFAFYEAMARPSDAPRRTLFIVLPLVTTAVGGLASALLFGRLAYVGYLVAGWGDAVGEPVGTAFGRTRYRVPSLGGVGATRSLEGSTAVFLVGALAAFLGLSLGGVTPAVAMGAALACAAVGTAVEAFSTHGLDNLTLQVAASGTAWLLLG